MEKEFSSFRDPSGFVYRENGKIYRQINHSYKKEYELLMSSGLYKKLTQKNYLISHKEIETDKDCYKVIKPDLIDYISYPYEWSFSMLKDAAILTLKIQKIALKRNMSLKDASGYNIQFTKDCKPIFIDTLSFEEIKETPWVAYAQFCRHFLTPLLLMSYVDIRLQGLLKNYTDGIPLDLASKLLPKKTYFNPSILIHIHMHAKTCAKYEQKTINLKKLKITKEKQINIIQSLIDFIKTIEWSPKNTEWGEYYTFTNYSDKSFELKKEIISKFIDKINPKNIWDLGANNGFFTRIGSEKNIPSIAFDMDPAAVEKNYLQIKNEKYKNLISILSDLSNPSPAIGWENKERESFSKRNKADLTMALAIVHHLSISGNLPFEKTAEFFKSFSKNLIIEFVPKEDSKVKILLSSREDIFPDYNEEEFEKIYSKYFNILDKIKIDGSKRTLYLMQNKN